MTKKPEIYREMKSLQDFCEMQPNVKIAANALWVGEMIANKKRLNQAYAEQGIPVPFLVESSYSDCAVFSNSNFGSATKVVVSEAGRSLDADRYNTKFINTVRSFKGSSYYVVLRAMCVGSVVTNIYVRARDITDGDPSVHSSDTPRDPSLLNYLYGSIVLPNYAEILTICADIGRYLGQGFYCHDILPDTDDEKTLYVCESGFKFDDATIKKHLLPIREHICFDPGITNAEILRSSAAFVLACCNSCSVSAT